MKQANILFADNDPDFLNTRREFLEREGYVVATASSPAEAREKLDKIKPDLAILDIRLANDDDEKDMSGLRLAQEIGSSIPVLLLTGYPAIEYARQALKPQLDGLPAAYDFIIKQEGPEAMLNAVQHALGIAKNKKQIRTRAIQEEARPTWKRWIPAVALIALLLALFTGLLAMVYGNPNWLFGTVALTIICVFLIGLVSDQAE